MERNALIKALATVRARGEAASLSGQHVHWTDAEVADLVLAELPSGLDALNTWLSHTLASCSVGDCDCGLDAALARLTEGSDRT